MRRPHLFVLVLLCGLNACAAMPPVSSVKVPQATGGSRTDGTVELSYEHDRYEESRVDWESARATARERCQVWGYADAVPFGGIKEKCQVPDDDDECPRFVVTVPYQCTGSNQQQSQ